MASRYLKIPVYQILEERTANGEVDSSYSKILKTLRIPQESITTTTGSPYIDTTQNVESAVLDNFATLDELIADGNFNSLLPGYPNSFANADNGRGIWLQIPLYLNKQEFNKVGGAIENYNKHIVYNSALWLRVSQELTFISPVSGKACSIYTWPFASNLFKESNAQYAIPKKTTEGVVGKLDVHGVYKILQERFIKSLNSNPGARETLIDFGVKEEELDAGIWNISISTDGNNTVTLNSMESPGNNLRPIVNGKCRLLVTCAAVTNLGQQLDPTNNSSVDNGFVVPTVGEVWNISQDMYGSYNGMGGNISDQTSGLNPRIFDGNEGGFSISGDDQLGQNNSVQLLSRICEFWSVNPAKGK